MEVKRPLFYRELFIPSGSVTSLKIVFKYSSNKLINDSRIKLTVFFYNIQRIGRTQRVREGGVKPANVVSNVVFCENETPSDIGMIRIDANTFL